MINIVWPILVFAAITVGVAILLLYLCGAAQPDSVSVEHGPKSPVAPAAEGVALHFSTQKGSYFDVP